MRGLACTPEEIAENKRLVRELLKELENAKRRY